MNKIFLVIGVVIIALGITAFSSVFVVHEATQALVVQFGNPQRVNREPGLQFKLPFVQDVIYFDKRVLDFDASAAEIPTLDQKQLVVDAYARFKIVDPLLYFQAVRDEVTAQSRLNKLIDASLREFFGGMPLAALLTTQRAELVHQIAANVKENALSFGIEVVDVRIKRVDLPEENSQAIFRRMQTQREQEARGIRAEGGKEAQRIRATADKQQRVIVAEAKKRAEILRGEGDANATKTYNEAFGQDREFFNFYQTMRSLNEGFIGEKTRYVGPPKGDLFRFFESDSILGGK